MQLTSFRDKLENAHLTTFILSIALLASNCFAQSNTTLIYAGTLMDIPGGPVKLEQTIVIRGQKISDVLDGFVSPDKFEDNPNVIDLKKQFVMPGLMDMHVHLQFEIGEDTDSDSLKMSSQLVQMRSAYWAMKTLEAGFTTVRDVGSSPQEIYALRDAIEYGWADGPRIIAAGIVGITGGHGDINGVRPDLMRIETSEDVCDGPYGCRRATRNAIKYGADWIKIMPTGGVLDELSTGTGLQMEADELREVVLAARRMGRKVAAHAHAEEGIVAALNAGVHSIEHGTYTGNEAIILFKKSGAYLVPTLLAGETVKEAALHAEFMSPVVKAKSLRVGNDMMGNLGTAYNAGVNIAFGTDSGVSPHGTNAQEAVLMQQAGMSTVDIIKSATVNSADLLDMSASIGSVEPGKFADIIAVDGSPLENIEQLLDVDFVMKGGKVYKNQ